jgi:cation diffusion facilitator CzcD-associated flavoprotein CzcO
VASKLLTFQRTAQWVLKLPNPRYSRFTSITRNRFPWLDRLAYSAYSLAFDLFAVGLTKPGLRRKFMAALCRASLREVRDPQLRRALTPDYTPACKRLVMSNGFYRAMQRDDVELVTAGIDHVERRGIVTDDGVLHETDIIVLATGFDTHAFFRPMQLTGRDGICANDVWRDGPRAYQTVALTGFPNFFMMMGPHSPVGNLALTTVAESQAEHILRWIERWRSNEFDTIEPTASATDKFNAELRAAMPDTVWTTGCDSWYLNKDGVPEVWPFTPAKHRAMLANTDPGQYDLRSYVVEPR